MTFSGKKNLKLNTERIKVVVTDVDGVLTDGKILHLNGKLYRFFNAKDGLGFRLLKLAGIKTVVISGKTSAESKKRFQKLETDGYFEGIKNKVEILEKFITGNGIKWDETCYIGDDLPDIPVMKKVGLPAAPFDAASEVYKVAQYICKSKGGEGAFREVSEVILRGKGLWEKTLQRFLSS
jgi:3-deoxy-D-manno-octulosonate 8-phosphate phosphatase (KDO 8-P phosphatase)